MFVSQTNEHCDDGSGFVPVIPLLLDPIDDTKEDEVSTFRHILHSHTHTRASELTEDVASKGGARVGLFEVVC